MKLISDQSILNALIWLVCSLFTLIIGLIVYMWQSLIGSMKKIDTAVVGFIISSSKNAEDILKVNKDIDTLYIKDSKRQSEIQAMDKDLAIVKHKLAI